MLCLLLVFDIDCFGHYENHSYIVSDKASLQDVARTCSFKSVVKRYIQVTLPNMSLVELSIRGMTACGKVSTDWYWLSTTYVSINGVKIWGNTLNYPTIIGSYTAWGHGAYLNHWLAIKDWTWPAPPKVTSNALARAAIVQSPTHKYRPKSKTFNL